MWLTALTLILAVSLQNPFADLILFPMQNITALGVGPDDGSANVLNLQLEAYGVPIRPDGGPDLLILLTHTLLFPE